MENLLQDLRYGVRMFLNRPAFAAVIIITLALGIGANTSIFCIVHSLLIRPLPFKEPDRLVMIWESNLSKGVSQDLVAFANLADWRDQTQVFEEVSDFDSTNFVLAGGDEAERIPGCHISSNLFRVLGVSPRVGRDFNAEDEQPGHEDIILVSHELWQRRFGADPNLIGKPLKLDNKSYTVVGIMPPGFNFPRWLEPVGAKNLAKAELWAPLVIDAEAISKRGARYLSAIGRLRPGMRLAQAQAELEPVVRALEQQYPENEGYRVVLVPMQEQIVGRVKSALLILFGAIAFVLLIACANVASLLLARATSRQKEIALRMALGCSRSRLIRQLLTESVSLGLIGGLAGLLVAYWGVGILVTSFPDGLPQIDSIKIDGRALGFTILISIVTGVLFGLIPALQSSKPDLNQALKEGGRGASAGFSNRTRAILVVSEIALALVLLIGAGLMIKSFVHLMAVYPGFNPDNVLTLRIALPASKYAAANQKVAFFQQLTNRIENVPGVQSAGATTNLPLSGTSMSFRFMIEGRQEPSTEIHLAQYHAITPNYLRTMAIPLMQGRDFTEQDAESAPGVVIINKSLARRFFPDQDPIGQKIKITYGKPMARQIVGVIDDVKHKALETDSQEEVYVPFLQNPWSFMTVVVRSDAEVQPMAGALRSAVWSLDKDQPIDSIIPMSQLVSDSIAHQRFYAELLGIFAGLAIMLAAVGIYGLISYTVTQRTHEIGVRMALGARQKDVLILIVRQGLVLALTGMAIGLGGSWFLTRFLSKLLYGTSVNDPATFISVSLLLILISLIACYIPARRATRVDPMVALRYE
jgi:putative ABC transport system permease protein